MKVNQLTRGENRRLMYVESKDGLIDGARARIGWVTFSKSGRSVYFHGLTLARANVAGGNFIEAETGATFWVSGVKERGSNSHPAGARIGIVVDDDAEEACRQLREEGAA